MHTGSEILDSEVFLNGAEILLKCCQEYFLILELYRLWQWVQGAIQRE